MSAPATCTRTAPARLPFSIMTSLVIPSTGKEMLENLLQLAHVQVHVQRGSVHKTGCGGMFCQWVHSFNLKVFLQGQDIAVQVAQVARIKHDNEQITAQATEGSITCVLPVCNPAKTHPGTDPPPQRPATSQTHTFHYVCKPLLACITTCLASTGMRTKGKVCTQATLLYMISLQKLCLLH